MSNLSGGWQSYEDFIAKFDTPKTTDDCFTPPVLMGRITQWACEKYKIDPPEIIRPFYPNGDFINEDYTGKVVVDNPPFSLVSKIVEFFEMRNIPFFLFCPALVLPKTFLRHRLLITGNDIVYENGAKIKTNFVTSFGRQNTIKLCPKLYAIMEEENEKTNKKQAKKKLPKYQYPSSVWTEASLSPLAKAGFDFEITNFEWLHGLHEQSKYKKSIFGSGILVDDETAAKLQAAKLQKIVKTPQAWKLSDAEKEIVKKLNEQKTKKIKIKQLGFNL